MGGRRAGKYEPPKPLENFYKKRSNRVTSGSFRKNGVRLNVNARSGRSGAPGRPYPAIFLGKQTTPPSRRARIPSKLFRRRRSPVLNKPRGSRSRGKVNTQGAAHVIGMLEGVSGRSSPRTRPPARQRYSGVLARPRKQNAEAGRLFDTGDVKRIHRSRSRPASSKHGRDSRCRDETEWVVSAGTHYG